MEWYWIVFLLLVVLALFVLYKKKIITVADIGKLSDAVDTLAPLATGGGILDSLIKYCTYAFHAAEQLAKAGQIAAEERKNTAVALVQQYAAVDGTTLTAKEITAAGTLLEAQCDINRNTVTFAEPVVTLSVEDTDADKDTATLQQGVYEGEAATGVAVEDVYPEKATGTVSTWDTDQLRAYCALNGIDVSASTTDGQIIDAIEAAGNTLPKEPEKA